MNSLSKRQVSVNDDTPCTGTQSWCWQTVYTAADVDQFCEEIVQSLHSTGFGDKDIFGVRLAVEEGLINAIKHGHAGDTSKPVRVGYCADAEGVMVQIEDQGKGFDPEDLPDPLDPENMERCCGRGVFLIRTYMTWVRYNDRGNCVTFCRVRSA